MVLVDVGRSWSLNLKSEYQGRPQKHRQSYGGDLVRRSRRNCTTSRRLAFWPWGISIMDIMPGPRATGRSSFPAQGDGCILAPPAALPVSSSPTGAGLEKFLQLAL